MKSPELNRRQMLAVGAAGSSAFAWTQELPAADDVKPLTFIIVSDTHLGRNDSSSPEKNWRKAIAEINNQSGEFVLHLGDVVDGGREAQYPVYLETRRELKKPIHEIPGNHDPAELFRKYVANETDRCVDYGDVRFVLMNNAHRDSHDGFFTVAQVAWLEQQCTEAATMNLKVIICCHVPVHKNRNPDRGWHVKPENGQTQFYDLLLQHEDRILACLHGHFHNGIRGWRDHGRTVEVLCPSVCYNQNRNLAARIADGKASGFFVNELRPGYVIAELGNGQFKMRYKPLGADLNGEYAASWR